MAGQPPNSEFCACCDCSTLQRPLSLRAPPFPPPAAVNVGAIMSLSQLRQAGRQGMADLEMGAAYPRGSPLERSPPRWGTSRDFLCGFSLGVVLGFISLFFLLERSFTPMHRVGLVMGLATHFVTRTLTAYVGPDSDQSSGGKP